MMKPNESPEDIKIDCVPKDNPMYKCIRCDSKDINPAFEIKHGIHNWYLCQLCSRTFFDWAMDVNADI